jgi:hypothetical protein
MDFKVDFSHEPYFTLHDSSYSTDPLKVLYCHYTDCKGYPSPAKYIYCSGVHYNKYCDAINHQRYFGVCEKHNRKYVGSKMFTLYSMVEPKSVAATHVDPFIDLLSGGRCITCSTMGDDNPPLPIIFKWKSTSSPTLIQYFTACEEHEKSWLHSVRTINSYSIYMEGEMAKKVIEGKGKKVAEKGKKKGKGKVFPIDTFPVPTKWTGLVTPHKEAVKEKPPVIIAGYTLDYEGQCPACTNNISGSPMTGMVHVYQSGNDENKYFTSCVKHYEESYKEDYESIYAPPTPNNPCGELAPPVYEILDITDIPNSIPQYSIPQSGSLFHMIFNYGPMTYNFVTYAKNETEAKTEIIKTEKSFFGDGFAALMKDCKVHKAAKGVLRIYEKTR